jgi:hypothetical protein
VYVPSLDLGPPHPLSPQRVSSHPSPPQPKGGGVHVMGRESTNSDDWRESLVLCLLCARHDNKYKKPIGNYFSQMSLGLCLLLVTLPIFLKTQFYLPPPPSPQQLYWIQKIRKHKIQASWAQGYKHNKCTYTNIHTVVYCTAYQY